MPRIIDPLGGGYAPAASIPLSAFRGGGGYGMEGIGRGIEGASAAIAEAVKDAARLKAESGFIDQRGQWEERISKRNAESAERIAKLNQEGNLKGQALIAVMNLATERERARIAHIEKKDDQSFQVLMAKTANLLGYQAELTRAAGENTKAEKGKMLARQGADYQTAKNIYNELKDIPELTSPEAFQSAVSGGGVKRFFLGDKNSRYAGMSTGVGKILDKIAEKASVIQDPKLREGVMQDAIHQMRGLAQNYKFGDMEADDPQYVRNLQMTIDVAAANRGVNPSKTFDWSRAAIEDANRSLTPEQISALKDDQKKAIARGMEDYRNTGVEMVYRELQDHIKQTGQAPEIAGFDPTALQEAIAHPDSSKMMSLFSNMTQQSMTPAAMPSPVMPQPQATPELPSSFADALFGMQQSAAAFSPIAPAPPAPSIAPMPMPTTPPVFDPDVDTADYGPQSSAYDNISRMFAGAYA